MASTKQISIFGVIFIILQNFTGLASSQEETLNITLSEHNPSYLWKPSAKSESISVETDPQFTISVTVSNLKFEEVNYLLLKAGSAEIDYYEKQGRVFANSLAKPYKLLFRTNAAYGQFVLVNSKYPNNAVDVLFELTDTYGPEPTTVPPTTTDSATWPTSKPNITIFTNVYVAGKTLTQFKDEKVQNDFKNALVDIADQYCNENNIVLLEDIASKNVYLTLLGPCPSLWPKASTCVEIKFKLPIVYDKSDKEYKFTKDELDTMWLRYADPVLKKYNLSSYHQPNYDVTITWWVIGIVAVLCGFTGLLWLVREFSIRFNRQYRKYKNAQVNDHNKKDTISRKTSVASLEPHYLQPN